ncbi:hypothetical protein C2G38_2169181 [Gigaspora rosea]|uniref:Uncharacterized protein n=1 Tax=Gigaspora rosea TaxID=44941 RepID=A0A397VNU2_9GLOM|nr:hypothetical protein C2G38_2169181 [Gigaspora rosea]
MDTITLVGKLSIIQLINSDLNNKEAESIEMLDSNLSSVNMNVDKAEHEFVSLLDNKILYHESIKLKIYVTDAKRNVLMCKDNPDLEMLLTNNPHEASVHVMCLTKIKPEL